MSDLSTSTTEIEYSAYIVIVNNKKWNGEGGGDTIYLSKNEASY